MFATDGPSECCDGSRERAWLSGWTRVELEFRVGSRIPDITLLRDEVAMGAIEVFAANAVSDEKAADLERMGIPWLEVRANAQLYEGASPWQFTAALPVHREGPATAWRCAACVHRQRKIEDKLKNCDRVHCARIVDYYYRTGRKFS
jgi:hypothetical protein